MKPIALVTLLAFPLCAAPMLPTAEAAEAAGAKAAQKKVAQTKAARPLASHLTIPAHSGHIRITPMFHATMQIEFRGKVIQVDPSAMANYATAKKADFILITHAHADHFDAKTIEKLCKGKVFAPQAVVDALRKEAGANSALSNNLVALKNGERRTIAGVMTIEVIPAYNLERGPSTGKRYHPKGWGNGYVLELGRKRIYIAGDTEATPEMRRLKNINVAFLPMNLPFTMTPKEAADAAFAFKPDIVIPYHYRYPFDKPNTAPQDFEKALHNRNVRGKMPKVYFLQWYPG